MDPIINKILEDNDMFKKYKFNIGFYDKNKKCFNSYISKNIFLQYKKKFNKFNYDKKNTIIYKYLNLQNSI